MVVLGMEEGDAGRLGRDNVPCGIEDLLGRDGALEIVDAVDRAGRDLAPAADLQVPRPMLMWTVVKRRYSRWWSFWI